MGSQAGFTLGTPRFGNYVLSRHSIFTGQTYTQNNFRASVGIVYRFGVAIELTQHEDKVRIFAKKRRLNQRAAFANKS